MKIVDRQNKTCDRNAEVHKRESAIRAHIAGCGYRLMHRRNNQYWLMLAEPMSLDEIEVWARFGDSSHKHSRKNNKARKVR